MHQKLALVVATHQSSLEAPQTELKMLEKFIHLVLHLLTDSEIFGVVD
jgi:hypothetical protein